MNKRPLPLPWAYLALIVICFSCSREDPSKVLERHLPHYEDISKNYVYQSVLRLANLTQDPDFDNMIRDIRKITIYQPTASDSTFQIKDLRADLREEGYEELMDFKTADKARASLWLNESFKKPHYIGLLDSAEDDYIFEIDGEIDLEYVSALNLFNPQTLQDLIN